MPIYEYVCQECGSGHEQLVRLADASPTDCPACGKPALQRKMSAAVFRLAGGGWYETDFKKDGRRHLAQDDKPGAEASKKTDSGADSKADTKKDVKKDTASKTSSETKKAEPKSKQDKAASGSSS